MKLRREIRGKVCQRSNSYGQNGIRLLLIRGKFMIEISKRDWKLFREKIGSWQETYMERLEVGYIALLESNEPASKKFWELERRIREDKRNPGVRITLEKSEVLWDLIRMVKLDVISISDLEEFSEDLREEVVKRVGVEDVNSAR